MGYYEQNTTIRNNMTSKNYGHVGLREVITQDKKHAFAVDYDGKQVATWVLDESWDKESYIEADSALECVAKLPEKVAIQWLKDYCTSASATMALEDPWAGGDKDEQKRTYVKISKSEGKSYIDLHIDGMIKKIGLSVDYLKSIASLDYGKSSAVLFKGYYICPMSLAFELGKRLGINKADAVKMANEWLAGV